MATTSLAFQDYPDEMKLLAPFGPFRAVLDRVIDGDTILVEIALAFQIYTLQSLRIAGINAPELRSSDPEERVRGAAARDFLTSVLTHGTPLVIFTDKDRRSFNRYVADVQMSGDRDVAAMMIDAGHAVAAIA